MFDDFITKKQLSANDPYFADKFCRTNPLPNTTHHISNYPIKLIVYKIQASKFWQVRCWFDGQYIKRSTKTQSLMQAKKFARFFYEETLAQRYLTANNTSSFEKNKETLPDFKSLPFGALAAQMLANEEARCARGELSAQGFKIIKNRVDKFLLPRWSAFLPKDITYQHLLDFTQFLSINFKTTTISQYLFIVKKILNHALSNGNLDKLPEFPKVKVTSLPRGGFTPTEYWKLLRSARKLIGTLNLHTQPSSPNFIRINYKDRQFPYDVSWIIGFMVNSFIRPSDIFNLKHKHIEIINAKNTYLRLSLPESKSHNKPIVTLYPAVRIYRQIIKWQNLANQCKPDDYVFFPHILNRNYAKVVLWIHFNWLLHLTELKLGPHGQSRSIYCLRHSAITFRLLYGQGIDLLTLARNSRTSIEMINKYYASSLTGEQNIALLQSRRSPRSTS